MTKNPIIEQLIEAHLDFLDQELSQAHTIQNEFASFYHWFRKQQLNEIWSFDQMNELIQTQILSTPTSSFLIEQIAEHLRFALVHSVNDSTEFADLIPVLTVDKIAQYISSKTEHRERLIKTIVNHQAFSSMLTQLIQHSIQDYLENSAMVKHVPGVSSFMKIGKSVLESMTDSNLEYTITQYLQKNIQKFSQMSEHVLNQHFDQNKLYHFQANLWHKVKTKHIPVLNNYIKINDLPNTVQLTHEVWEHLRQTDYLKQQVHDGIYAWYIRNQNRSFDLILRDLNIDENLINNELNELLSPIIQHLVSTEQLRLRARFYLEKFYYSDTTLNILKKIS